MKQDCHVHMLLDGVDWKKAIERHREGPDYEWIRNVLKKYQQLGYTYLRDGGDRWGVGAAARKMAPEYGITYKTPLAPIYKAGNYGSFIGVGYENLKEFAKRVVHTRDCGGDFIKIMISGLMDFNRYGVLTQPGLPETEIRELIHIAHEEGMAVMVHGNGNRTVLAAAEAGVESVEHGAYLKEEALCAMKEANTVWVPTLSTVGNLRGKGRFPEESVVRILEDTMQALSNYKGFVACGTDAGAWAVPHGSETETDLLSQAGISLERIAEGNQKIRERF